MIAGASGANVTCDKDFYFKFGCKIATTKRKYKFTFVIRSERNNYEKRVRF